MNTTLESTRVTVTLVDDNDNTPDCQSPFIITLPSISNQTIEAINLRSVCKDKDFTAANGLRNFIIQDSSCKNGKFNFIFLNVKSLADFLVNASLKSHYIRYVNISKVINGKVKCLSTFKCFCTYLL